VKLVFNGVTRSTNNQDEIANLLRKGWTELIEAPKEIPTINERDVKWQLFNKKVAEGFLVEPENFTIGLDENDRAAFSQMLSLVKEALDLGLITNETPQTISDKSGQKHQLATLRFRQVMVAYGFYFKGLWDELDS
jgi:hypothetical protein